MLCDKLTVCIKYSIFIVQWINLIFTSFCLSHTYFSDSIQPVIVQDNNLFIVLQGDYLCVLPAGYTGTVTFMISQAVTASITIICLDNVDCTLRFLVIFPDTANINLVLDMCADTSTVNILGMCVLAKKQSVNIMSKQIHGGKKTTSRLVLQAMLADQANLRYEGTIRIEKNADQTYALQNNKNILLSSTAQVISIPNIEVLHHDVQCYHGSAIGRFDSEHKRYLQSRGLPQAVIKKLLIEAFFAQVLETYEDKDAIFEMIYKTL